MWRSYESKEGIVKNFIKNMYDIAVGLVFPTWTPKVKGEIDVPVYFFMGKYDGMTSPEAANAYLDDLICHQGKEFVIFECSAHFPQFEESDLFLDWLCGTLSN